MAATEPPIEPIFLDSEPTHTGRKQKAKDMSELTLCLCEERAKPDDIRSIQCQKAGCAMVWVCVSMMFRKFITDTAYSIIFTVLDMRTCNQKAGYASHACASQAQVRSFGIIRKQQSLPGLEVMTT